MIFTFQPASSAYPCKNIDYIIKINENSRWFSEVSLATFFKKKDKDNYREGTTYCDAIYGNFDFYPNTLKVMLKYSCKELVVIEAKVYSKFSSGTTHAKGEYDQASRIICCMGNLFTMQNEIENIEKLAFYTIIPKHRDNDKNYKNILINLKMH